MNEHIEYLITELVNAASWREGCLEMFGVDDVTSEELPMLLKKAGRAYLYRNNTFSNEAVVGAESFEDFCDKKVYSYPMVDYLTKAMIIKAFEKELRNDYEYYCEKYDEENYR